MPSGCASLPHLESTDQELARTSTSTTGPKESADALASAADAKSPCHLMPRHTCSTISNTANRGLFRYDHVDGRAQGGAPPAQKSPGCSALAELQHALPNGTQRGTDGSSAIEGLQDQRALRAAPLLTIATPAPVSCATHCSAAPPGAAACPAASSCSLRRAHTPRGSQTPGMSCCGALHSTAGSCGCPIAGITIAAATGITAGSGSKYFCAAGHCIDSLSHSNSTAKKRGTWPHKFELPNARQPPARCSAGAPSFAPTCH